MKAIVRDDIIALDSFVAAEFKYKEYLELLMKSGNYCFLDQFKKQIPSGESIVKGMIENNLLGTENLNNSYKYIYLSDTAMKYLYLRTSEEDFSKVKKNRISVKKVNKNPSEKQLLSSAYKFHLMANSEDLIDKESILKGIEDYIFIKKHKTTYAGYEQWLKKREEDINTLKESVHKINNEQIDFINNIKKINTNLNLLDARGEAQEVRELKEVERKLKEDIEIKSNEILKRGLNELKEELSKVQSSIKEAEKILITKNKVIENFNNNIKEFEEKKANYEEKLEEIERKTKATVKLIEEGTLAEIKEVQGTFENLYNISKIIARIKDNTLEFMILDTGNFKTAYGYLKQINTLGSLAIGYEKVKILIYSYAENRAENLYNEFIKAKKDKEKALDTMRKYNLKTENSPTKSDFYIAAKKVYDNTPEFEVEIKNDFYYMKSYKELISSTTRSIKRKDKKAIDDLIEKLKK